MKRPLLHTFATGNQRYAYDFGTNDFYIVSEPTWRSLQTPRWGDVVDPEITEAQSRGIFKVFAAEKFSLPKLSQLEATIESNLGALILCVSEQCNMRCGYCTYGGSYQHTRTHSENFMSWKVAKSALDYYLPRTSTPTLGFFGGEPLLAWSLIKRIVDYAASKITDYKLNLTTNGTLLCGPILDWLASSGVSVLVSVDGTQEIHDRYRRMLSGRPSFNVVMNNLNRAAKQHPQWFRNSVRVQMVVTPPYDLRPYEELVLSHRHLFQHPAAVSVSYVNTQDTNAIFTGPVLDQRKHIEVQRIRDQYKRGHVSNSRDQLTIEPSLLDTEIYRIHRRPIFDEPSANIPLNGTCLPGFRRLYVDNTGRFHMCERINETLPIGSVSDGLGLDKVMRLLNEYAQTSLESCRHCWAARFCPLCFIHAAGDGCIDCIAKNKRCDEIRQTVEKGFILYNSILEESPAAFDYMDEYYML